MYCIYEQNDLEPLLESNAMEDFEEGFMQGYLNEREIKKKAKKK